MGYGAGSTDDRKYTKEDWLREQYYGNRMTMKKVAQAARVSPATILRYMKKHDIKRRPEGTDPYSVHLGPQSEREWLEEKHHDEGLSVIEVAEEADSTPNIVMWWLDVYDLEMRQYMPDHVKEPLDQYTESGGEENEAAGQPAER